MIASVVAGRDSERAQRGEYLRTAIRDALLMTPLAKAVCDNERAQVLLSASNPSLLLPLLGLRLVTLWSLMAIIKNYVWVWFSCVPEHINT